ncbi:hypothetical protein ACRWQL_09125 [Shewanella sp. HL-SH4]|uniref:hypothetical protein n=1 Tax=Shewanella sp. HL-SH4 TaxID=3436240 RepID=UPI003EBF3F38
MLFSLAPLTPKFKVFHKLNEELLYFLQHAVPVTDFSRGSLSAGAIGQACWNNAKRPKGKEKLTKDKFQELHLELQNLPLELRQQLFEIVRDNQNLQTLFATPNHDLLSFLPKSCLTALKELGSHLYGSTKTLQPIVNDCDGITIDTHFNSFKQVNGEVCRVCGLEKIAAFRANISTEQQWRADYDHFLCKSKYPIYAVHPDNLFPICQTCNQDAKKAEDLFYCTKGKKRRSAFYPFTESAESYVELVLLSDKDPEPKIQVNWTTRDALVIEKLNTWNDVFQIKNLVEGRFISLENFIQDELNPDSLADLQAAIATKIARPYTGLTLTRKPEAFWQNKLYTCLASINIEPLWEQCSFIEELHGQPGAEFIMGG